MNTRHDFFTLIHKGQRNELFAATVLAGTINWEDASAANDFVSLWSKLSAMLDAHAAHEHNHMFPLLAQHAPETVEQVEAAHDDLEHRLVTLTASIAQAADQRTQGHGLAVYREITAFVAQYLLHILDEETRHARHLAVLHRCRDQHRPVELSSGPIAGGRHAKPPCDPARDH